MSRRLRILLVEDMEDDAKLLLMELRHGGWEIVHERVQSADAMSNALSSKSWDIIISDYSMPKFSGLAALNVAREQAADLPFILVSGTVGEEIAVQAMKAGADDYLFKGNLKRLVPTVERELRDAQTRREAKQTEQELQQRKAQLADAQRIARVGSWYFDFRTHGALWSDEAYRILGRETGTTASFEEFLSSIHPNDRQLMNEAMESQNGKQFGHDCRVVRPDDAVRFVHIGGDVVRDGEGKPIEATGMIQDITERKTAEQELRKAHDELSVAKETAEAASRAKDQFLAVLSHELRTPLTPVLAVVSHFESQGSLPEDLRQDLSIIRRNVEMEAHLIDDLLDLTRIIRDKMELHYEVVDVHSIVRRAMEPYEKEIAAKELEVVISLQAKHHNAWADPARLLQVFSNLMSNAVKFTHANGTITIRSTDAQGVLRVQIADNGIGVEADVLPRLFNKFEQGERTVTRRFGGLGLGLSIAKSLVEMHGGKIAIASEGRDKGTTLSVELKPMLDVATKTATSTKPAVAAMAPTASVAGNANKAYRVLLVEDHEDTRRIMARLLKSVGYSVTTAGTVKEALQLANKDAFNLLISDIGLPDGSGTEIMQQLKSSVKGIAISGFGHEEDLRRSRDAGFETHLTKPVDFMKLQDEIRKVAC